MICLGRPGCSSENKSEFRIEVCLSEDLFVMCAEETGIDRFLELCQTDSVSALSYLKKEIGDLVVFDAATQAQDPVARQVYRDCLNHLLSAPSSSSGQFHSASTIDAGLIATSKLATLSSAGGTLRWEQRTQTFSKLLRLFPANLQEPIDNLIDLATA